MKRVTIIAGGAATAVLAGSLLAVPALADNAATSAPSSTTTPLTATEKNAIDGFLDDHLGLAHALAARAQAWAAFLKAHPDIAAEVAKVKALPSDQRRAEARKWFADHPDARTAIRDWRSGLREQRSGLRDQRGDLRDQRRARRTDRQDQRSTSSSV
jgi:hemophore-related protein